MNFFLNITNKKIKELNTELKTVKEFANQFINVILDKTVELKNENDKLKKIKTPEHIIELINKLYITSHISLECPVCLDLIQNDNFTMTTCGHHYCIPCLKSLEKSNSKQCAICNEKLLKSINSRTNNINVSANS
jgi:hypothetical protein